MKVIPAIDLKDGNVVRLLRGDYDRLTVYSANPAEVARRWHLQGASLLHVVDLDGALMGEPKNIDSVAAIVKSVNIPIELGGGIRSLECIKQALDIGVARIILGTKVTEDMDFISSAVRYYGERIIVSVDAKNGLVMMQGWTKSSSINAADMARRMELLGVSTIIYTDVSADGTLAGPDFTRVENFLNNVNIPVIIAGGVSSIDDLRKLQALGKKNLAGAIIGKALYEGQINLSEAISTCLQNE